MAIAQTAGVSQPAATAAPAPSIQDLEARLRAMQQQLVELRTREDDATKDQAAEKTEVSREISDFRGHEATLMVYATDFSAKISWILGGLGILITLLNIGAVFLIERNTKSNLESEVAKVKLEFNALAEEVRREGEKARRSAHLAERDAGTVHQRRIEIEVAAKGVDSIVAGIKNAVQSNIATHGSLAKLEGRGLATADTARLRSDADTLAMFPGDTPFDKAFEQGLVEQARNNPTAALAAFVEAAAIAPGPLEKAKSLYSQAAMRLLMDGTASPRDDAMPLLDEVIAEESELLALPGGDAVLARAHMVRAELLRMQGQDRSAIAGYTWLIDRFPRTSNLVLQQLFAAALLQRGQIFDHETISDGKRAMQDFNEVLRAFADASDPTLRRQVASAVYHKGLILCEAGAMREAVEALATAQCYLEGATDAEGREMLAEAQRVRAEVLAALAAPHGVAS
jgi:tetratricopeptide (TPR) repeat protein